MIRIFKLGIILLSLFFTLNLISCATFEGMKQDFSGVKSNDTSQNKKQVSDKPCINNYSVEGSFWTGRTFKTFQEYSNVKKETAYKNLSQQLALDGWKIINSNKETGVITAAQGVIHGDGAEVPLNIILKNGKTGGTRVDISLAVTGMLAAGGIEEEFCKILASVAQ